jgi:hypothetical protein
MGSADDDATGAHAASLAGQVALAAVASADQPTSGESPGQSPTGQVV